MSTFKINEKGFWEDATGSGHIHDQRLATAIYKNHLESGKTLLDLGCGKGDYIKYFKSQGCEVTGLDGNPHTPALSDGLAGVQDISVPFSLGKKFDVVISLEVGEHIPAEYESTLIDNIIKHAKNKIITSWAVPGQGGDGHVNCRTNEYIIDEFEKRGWEYNRLASSILRTSSSLPWFKKTLFVFERYGVQ